MKTIAVINQKGGVGKTTTVANLGAALAEASHATCLIDLDPQSHLTLHVGVEPGAPPTGTYDVLGSDVPVAAARVEVRPGLSLVPADIDLAAAEQELVTTVGREQVLRDRLAAQPLDCEFVLIDCPPSLGLLTLNALAAADEVIIPLQPHFLALQGLGKLLETVLLVQQRLNRALRVSGVILCMFESTTRLAGEVLSDLQGFFAEARDEGTPWADARIYRTIIRRNIKLAECPSHGRTIFEYEPSSRGAEDYQALAREFLAAHGCPQAEDTQQAAERTEPDQEDTRKGESAEGEAPRAASENPAGEMVHTPPSLPARGDLMASGDPGSCAPDDDGHPAPEKSPEDARDETTDSRWAHPDERSA